MTTTRDDATASRVHPARDAGVFDAERRAMTTGLVLIVTLVAFEALAVATAMPAAERDLGGIRFYGWAFSGFLLASLIGITAAGEECDRRGPARPFVAGIVLFSAGLAVAGLAPSMPVLVLGRVVQGLGAGAVPSVAYVAIGRAYDPGLRPRMFAVLSSAWVIPGLIGPAIAGAVAEYATWRAVFIGLLPLIALAAVLVVPPLRALGPPPRIAGAPSRVGGALRLAAGAAMAVGGAASGEAIVAVLLVPAGIALGLPALLRLSPGGTLRAAPGVPAAIAGMALLNMAFFGAEAFVPLMITSVRDASSLVAGLALTASTLSWTAASWVQERAGGRVTRRAFVAAGFALVAAGIGITSAALAEPVPVAVTAAGWTVAGAGMGLAYPSISLLVLAGMSSGEEGAGAAALKLNEVLGAALGAGAGGALVALGDARGWETAALALTFGALAAVAVLGLRVAPRLAAGTATADVAM